MCVRDMREWEWAPIWVAMVGVQVKRERVQAQAVRWMTTATGWLRVRVEVWWTVGKAKVGDVGVCTDSGSIGRGCRYK